MRAVKGQQLVKGFVKGVRAAKGGQGRPGATRGGRGGQVVSRSRDKGRRWALWSGRV